MTFDERRDLFRQDLENIFFQSVDQYEIKVVFYLTEHCNLHCPGCYRFASPNVSERLLPVEDVEHYTRELKKLPNIDSAIAFSGGEIFTTPTQYLKTNIENAFCNGFKVQLKSNGKWIEDKAKTTEIFGMIRNLENQDKLPNFVNQPVLEYIVKEKITFLQRLFFRIFRRWVSDAFIIKYIKKQFGINFIRPPLGLVLSVDDVIHSRKSVEWYKQILKEIIADDTLRANVSLGLYTFEQSRKLVEDGLWKSTDIKLDKTFDEDLNLSCWLTEGYPNIMWVGSNIVDPMAEPFDKNANWLERPESKDGNLISLGLLKLFFWPDRTVSVDSKNNYQPLGRVPYIDNNGKHKDINTIKREMVDKICAEYCATLR